jgi:hypothetical protein
MNHQRSTSGASSRRGRRTKRPPISPAILQRLRADDWSRQVEQLRRLQRADQVVADSPCPKTREPR